MTLSQNNVTEFPKERVCVIDGNPIVQKSIQDAFYSLKKIGLTASSLKYLEKDVRTYFYFFCIQNLYSTYNTTDTKYRKVLSFYITNKNNITDNFIKNNLTYMLKGCTFPWCIINTPKTPELCSIALKVLEKKQASTHQLAKFLEKNNLHTLTRKIKKNVLRQKNIVDFSRDQE